MVRLGWLLGCLLAVCGALHAATLERLTLDEMVVESTVVVRAVAGQSRSVQAGGLIYTLVEIEVREQWKGDPVSRMEVALPGGRVGKLSQHFGGVPDLEPGQEFVAFLWTGPSGLTHIIGLNQGFFDVLRGPNGETLVHRKTTGDLMLAPNSASPVPYSSIKMALTSLVDRIDSLAKSAGGASQ